MSDELKYESIINIANQNIIKTITDFSGFNYNIIAPDGTFIVINKNMASKINYNKKAGDIDSKSWKNCLEVMKQGKRVIIEEYYKDKVYLSFKTPIIENNKCNGILILSIDITEKKQAEIAKERFIDNIYHEVFTCLSGMDMLSGGMMRAEQDNHKKENLVLINKASNRLKDYLSTVLDYISARDIKNNEYNKKINFNIKTSLNNIIDMIKPAYSHKNIKINLDCPDDSIVHLNKTSFEKIVLNLLSNAIKFTEQGEVNIKIDLIKNNKLNNKNKLILIIQDTGIGIAKKNQKTIFDLFERVVSMDIEPEYKGCGLGLSIVKKLVDQMKGKISLTSQIKKGSVFRVEWEM